jgi:hypothetical protein
MLEYARVLARVTNGGQNGEQSQILSKQDVGAFSYRFQVQIGLPSQSKYLLSLKTKLKYLIRINWVSAKFYQCCHHKENGTSMFYGDIELHAKFDSAKECKCCNIDSFNKLNNNNNEI